MFCPKCGEKNVEGAKFCSKCGANLQELVGETKEVVKQPVKKEVAVKNNTPQENVVGDIFKHMLNAFIKPFDSFKKSGKKLSTTTYSLIYSAFVCGIAWILSIISTIISGAKSTSFGWSGTVTTWNFARLNYVKIIFVNLLVYVALVAAIAGVYCLASLVVKKTVSYTKMLAITCTSIMPYIISTVFLAPLFGLLHHYVGAFFAIAGLVYSILIFFGLIKEEIEIKNKEKALYFHLICVGVLAFVFYITFVNFGSMNIIRNTSLLDKAMSKFGF